MKRVILVLLLTLILCLCFALASCGDREKGENGANGADGVTPHIGENGNWFIGENDTGIPATGAQGPQGPQGDKGDQGEPGENGEQGVGIEKVEVIDGELVVTYTDGTVKSLGKLSTLLGESETELAFYPLDDGTYAVSCGNAKLLSSIVIPETYKGKAVSQIIRNGFENCENLKTIVIPNSITIVGSYAFRGCTSLTSVTIPEGVTTIGEYAFRDCTSLTEINFNAVAMNDLSSDNYVFNNAGKNGEGIKVTIGKDVTKIPAYLFYPYVYDSSYPPKITSVEFEEGSACTTIGSYAFYDCDSLTSITIPDSVTTIGNYAFAGCDSLTSITIPDSVTSIGEYAFRDCTRLTSITIPNSVTSIGEYAFSNCDSLTIYCEASSKPSGWSSDWKGSGGTVVWNCNNNDVASDGYIYTVIDGVRYALKNSEATVARQSINTTTANIPSSITYKGQVYSVTSIGNSAFEDCRSLTSITIGNSVTSIGKHAFYDCTGLTEINFNAISMGDLNYNYDVFANAGKNGEGIKVTIGKNVTKIPAYLFYLSEYDSSYSPKITSVEFEEGGACTTIGYYAFDNCTSLTSVTIGDSVTSIGDHVFSGCSSLTSVTIPDSVTSIGDVAFYYCRSLTSITIGNSVTSIGNYAFEYCTSLTIYCEASSKPSGWSSDWKGSGGTVKWGHTHSYTDGECICGVKSK